MAINDKTRIKLIDIFKGIDYKQIVSEKAGCHPNTVSNVLLKGTDNPKVELEIMILAQSVAEKKKAENAMRKKAKQIAAQL
jgi:hypothetical protein